MAMTMLTTMPVEVVEYLRLHHVITLSTPSFTGMPHADTVVYVNDDRRIYFFAGDTSVLARNIHDSHHVSFTIDDYLSDWRKLRELQGVGRGVAVERQDIPAVGALVAEKFGAGFAVPPGRLYAVSPIEMHFVDYDESNAPTSGGRRWSDPRAVGATSEAPVATRLARAVFEPGDVILRPGEVDVHFVVVEGLVEVRREGYGADQVVSRVGPGELFGDTASLDRRQGVLTAHALVRTVVLGVDRAAMRQFMMPAND